MKDKLEKIVDEQTLQRTLEDLAEICFEKSEHVLANWQDKTLAKSWEKAGTMLKKTAETNAKNIASGQHRP